MRSRVDAVAESADHVAIVEKLHLHFHAEATSPLACTGRIRHVLEFMQKERVLHLEHLRILSQQAAATGDQADMVITVSALRTSAAALQSVEQDIHKWLIGTAIETHGGDREKRIPWGGDALRQSFRQRIENGRRDLV